MDICIYLKKTEPEVTFNSAEHIIPAGIGGIRKLNYGTVCDQVNTGIFSNIEKDFMRNSIISIPRQFYGPGKRGSLSPQNASKSKVHVMTQKDEVDEVSLGYIKLGKPHQIPQFKINKDKEMIMIFDLYDGDYNEQLNIFINKLGDFDGQYILINDKKFLKDEIIVGFYENRWYVASYKEIDKIELEKIIKAIAKKEFEIKGSPIEQITHITSHQKMGFKIDYYFRVCAKIAFNYLAHCKGTGFVLQNKFDPIREWIVNGGENIYVKMIDKSKETPSPLEYLNFPEESHKVFILKSGKCLISYIGFYGNNFDTVICLCDNFDEHFNLDAYICDWKNRQEYTLNEYLHINRQD